MADEPMGPGGSTGDRTYELVLSLSNGNTISAGTFTVPQGEQGPQGKYATIDSELSTTSKNPVQNQVITEALNNKVTKETGKGLSTNDFTDTLLEKLNGLEKVNLYSHYVTLGVQGSTTLTVCIKINNAYSSPYTALAEVLNAINDGTFYNAIGSVKTGAMGTTTAYVYVVQYKSNTKIDVYTDTGKISDISVSFKSDTVTQII